MIRIGFLEQLDRLCASVVRLLEHEYQSIVFREATDLILMFGFYAFKNKWKRVCRLVSRLQADFEDGNIDQQQYTARVEQIKRRAPDIPSDIDIVKLCQITHVRNQTNHRELASISSQEKFLRNVETVDWPEDLTSVIPCIVYLKTQTLKRSNMF